MKILGLLGGVSWESTVAYYRLSTMRLEDGFWVDRTGRHGVEVIVPAAEDRDAVAVFPSTSLHVRSAVDAALG